MTMIQDTIVERPRIDQVDKSAIDALLADVAGVESGHYLSLDEGNPLYIDPVDTMLVRSNDIRGDLREDVFGTEHAFADFYDKNGRRIPLSERPEDWFNAQSAIRKPHTARYRHNAVALIGDDYIMIGRGEWVYTGITTLDGEVAYEFKSHAAYFRYIQAEKERRDSAFLDANPIIEASRPWWANSLTLEPHEVELGVTIVTYSYDFSFGEIYLTQEGRHGNGALTLDEVRLDLGSDKIPTSDYMTFANELQELAGILNRLAQEG